MLRLEWVSSPTRNRLSKRTMTTGTAVPDTWAPYKTPCPPGTRITRYGSELSLILKYL